MHWVLTVTTFMWQSLCFWPFNPAHSCLALPYLVQAAMVLNTLIKSQLLAGDTAVLARVHALLASALCDTCPETQYGMYFNRAAPSWSHLGLLQSSAAAISMQVHFVACWLSACLPCYRQLCPAFGSFQMCCK